MAGQPQGPGPAFGNRDGSDVQPRQRPRRRRLVVEEIPVLDRLDGDQGGGGSVGHGHQFAAASDPDVALGVGPGAVKNGDVGLDRRQQHHRPAALAQGVVDDLPIVPVVDQVRTDEPAQGHEVDPLLGRLQRGVDGRTGGIAHVEGAAFDGLGKPRRRTRFAEADGGRLQGLHRPGPDQQVGGQAADGHRQQVQVLDPTADQGPDQGHGHPAIFGRQRQKRPVGHPGGQAFKVFHGRHRRVMEGTGRRLVRFILFEFLGQPLGAPDIGIVQVGTAQVGIGEVGVDQQ